MGKLRQTKRSRRSIYQDDDGDEVKKKAQAIGSEERARKEAEEKVVTIASIVPVLAVGLKDPGQLGMWKQKQEQARIQKLGYPHQLCPPI